MVCPILAMVYFPVRYCYSTRTTDFLVAIGTVVSHYKGLFGGHLGVLEVLDL